MDSVDVCAATSTADDTRGSKRSAPYRQSRAWLSGLHLRKPAMQTPAPPAPKTTGAGSTGKKRPNHEELQRAIRGNPLLRFQCSQCADGTERAPKDLSRHFEEKHQGCLPVFACHACSFTTHDFSYLQVHALGHKDTFSCCSLCRDDVQRTWAEFSAHLAMAHTHNGKYTCEVCQKFSTSDDKEFLEHVLLHNLGLDIKTDTSFKCQFCGYEVSQKLLLTKHLKTVHANPDAFSTNEPKSNSRLTRSTVKDISWLTQDCLSLPGREFLDKYCHLSDTKTTLEETEHFLMKSGKQRWSKALQNVLSNVPHDTKPESGIVSVSPDSSQDVLTVKTNQNNGSFAKRLQLMPEEDRQSTDADSCERFTSDTSSSDCLQNRDIKPSSQAFMAESTEGTTMEENRENHRLKTHLQKRNVEDTIQDGVVGKERKTERRKAVRKALPKKKRKNLHWKNMKKKSKKADKSLALKIVLKKNSKTGKQWVTQASTTVLAQSKCNSTVDEMKTGNNVGVCRGELTKPDERDTEDRGTERTQDGRRLTPGARSVLVKEKRVERRGAAKAKTSPDCPEEAWTPARPVITAQNETSHPSISPLPLFNRTPPLPSPSSLPSPSPKSLERTLRLVSLRAAQPVRRPAGSQPVVVLNHPDADCPEVSRIMEAVWRHEGAVRKVVLSGRTLRALGVPGALAEAGGSVGGVRERAMGVPGALAEAGGSVGGVRERFLLKLRLRRVEKRKFEVVSGGGRSRAFRCWFCGRAFQSKDLWLTHKQRHLQEWERPGCGSS